MSLGRPRFDSGRGSSPVWRNWTSAPRFERGGCRFKSCHGLYLQDERQEMIWSHGVVVASGAWVTVVSVRFRLVPFERRQDERQEMKHTVWSSGQDSWLSTSRLGFKSRYRNSAHVAQTEAHPATNWEVAGSSPAVGSYSDSGPNGDGAPAGLISRSKVVRFHPLSLHTLVWRNR